MAAKVMEDCFAYRKRYKNCVALTELVCAKRKCSFYKSCEQHAKDKEKYPAKA